MANLAGYLDVNALRAVSASPHVLLENATAFSIVLNLLGVHESDIAIRVNENKREIAVLTRKEGYTAKRGTYWVFGVPAEGRMDSLMTRFRGGVLEITIPKSPRFPLGSVA